MIRRRCVLAILTTCAMASPATAHKPSDSYLRIDGRSDVFRIEWDIALRDLELLVGLDADQDGKITWGEVKRRQSVVVGHALSRLRIIAGGVPSRLQLTSMLANRHSDGAYAVLLLEGDRGPEEPVGIEYSLLFDVDPTHRGLVLYFDGEGITTHVLSGDSPCVELGGSPATMWSTLGEYTREGVWHIWIGLDHMLFLLVLLLPAVVVREDREWAPVEALRPACWGVLKIVSMFTIAHSITLWLAVMEYATPPSRVIEASIAASIVVTAMNNLFPVLPLTNGTIAFAFGLVHGFGFANVLIDLGLSDKTLAVALFGFNFGVELGQLAIVLAFMPIAYAIRGTAFYRWVVLRAGSVLVAAIALVWVYERAFNAKVIGHY